MQRASDCLPIPCRLERVHTPTNKVPVLLWPFYALWRLLTYVLILTGRVAGALLGFTLMICGGIIAMSIIGVPVGVPVFAFGLLLMIRALF